MIWATRPGCHVDRSACSWLISRFIDPQAEFVFHDEIDDVPQGAIPFDMRGADLSHHEEDCTFETILKRYELSDPVLWDLARIVHEADIGDEKFDAPAAVGLDAICRGLSMVRSDHEVIAAAHPLFEGLYEYRRHSLLLGRETG